MQIPKPSTGDLPRGLLLLGLYLKGRVNSVTLHICDFTTSCKSSSVIALPAQQDLAYMSWLMSMPKAPTCTSRDGHLGTHDCSQTDGTEVCTAAAWTCRLWIPGTSHVALVVFAAISWPQRGATPRRWNFSHLSSTTPTRQGAFYP